MPSFEVVVDKAIKLPGAAWQALETVPIPATIIISTLNKCVELDKIGRSPPQHWWIVIYSTQGKVAFVLSCTDGYMGSYPIFIVNTITLDDDEYISCIHLLVRTLQRNVPKERVYSVYAPIKISQLFAKRWTQLTGIQAEAKPYYDAKIGYLRWHEGLQQPLSASEASIFEIGPAGTADIIPVAEGCHMFASDSPPFTLTKDAALDEAKKLVQRKQVWVLKLRGKVVSIAAFTRNTPQVATITKVYSHPSSRGFGCAGRLVRRLCNSLLQDKGHETVVLFVGCDNVAARIYKRVGFQGLDNLGNGSAPDNAGRWMEIGFDRRKVNLGHW